MAAVRVNSALRIMWRLHRWLYATTSGKFGTRIGDQHLLLLTTIGRKSGQARPVVLTYIDEGDTKVVVASYAGEERHPDWWLNLQANLEATVRIRERRATGAGTRG